MIEIQICLQGQLPQFVEILYFKKENNAMFYLQLVKIARFYEDILVLSNFALQYVEMDIYEQMKSAMMAT